MAVSEKFIKDLLDNLHKVLEATQEVAKERINARINRMEGGVR